MRRTPLDSLHRRRNAKMVPFADHELPLQYPTGIKDEHLHVRAHAGLFDVSHMCQVSISGPDAINLLERLCPINADGMPVHSCRYTFFLNQAAGILDDLIVTRLSAAEFLLICNAARATTDLAHIQAIAKGFAATVSPIMRALIAIQGPQAEEILARQVAAVKQLRFMRAMDANGDKLISRTGYTGEDGFEIALPAGAAMEFVEALLAAPELWPIGLGARDSLRLEAGLCLYGQDLDESTNPVEAGLTWTIPAGVRTGHFIGADALRAISNAAPTRQRVGLRPNGPTPVRAGAELLNPADMNVIGQVTSGGYSPSLAAPVAMAYVAHSHATTSSTVLATVRGKHIPCRVVDLPFVPHNFQRS